MIDFVIDDEGDYESSMTGSDRRQEILKNIKESDRPGFRVRNLRRIMM